MQYLMSIDAGTGSVRATIFDTVGNQISIGQREWFHEEDPRYPGSMNFNTKLNWEIIKTCIAEALNNSKISANDLIAVSCTAMREGFVLYDKDCNDIFACVNVDARAVDEAIQLRLRESLEREVYNLSGQAFALSALPRMLWLKNKAPRDYENVKYITMLNDWIVFKLTGILGVDPSNGCTTGLFGYENRTWSPEISRMCGLKDDIFPQVYEGGTKIGNINKLAAEETGLKEKTIVVAGGGDAQLGSVGVGGVLDGDCCIFGGSFWQTEVNTKFPRIDKDCRVRLNMHAVPDIWQYEAIAFYPGIILRWFRDAFCEYEKDIEEQSGVSAYEQMDKYAAKVPVGSNGVLPIFSDVMNFIDWKHAAPSFLNLNLDAEKCNKYTIFRSLMENAALVTYGNLKMIESFSGLKVNNAIFAGGAAKSKLWVQILADVCGISIKTPVVKEAASLGAAMCAVVGAGVYGDLAEAAAYFVKFDGHFEPRLKNHDIYAGIFENWRKVYTNQLWLADSGLTSHMWKAPGL